MLTRSADVSLRRSLSFPEALCLPNGLPLSRHAFQQSAAVAR
jgi:hypothetical protein